MASIVAEMNWPQPLSQEELEDTDSALMHCIGERGGSWIRSYVNEDRSYTVCLFEAPDAQSIRDAYRHAGVHGAKVWVADVVAPASVRTP